MALKTLRTLPRIAGELIEHWENNAVFMEGPRPADGPFVHVDHDKNVLSFKIQDGPIKEVGVNGCQVDTIVATAKAIIVGLNEAYPCAENKLAILGLSMAMEALELRKANREARGVEGTNQA